VIVLPNTFTLIASSTVGSGGAASIDFTSIPQTYTDLQLVFSLRNATENDGTALYKINSSSSSFSCKILYGTGAAAASFSGNNTAGLTDPNTYTSNTFSNGSLYLPNYAGSTYKSASGDAVNENNATTSYTFLTASLWSNTAAITSLSLYPISGNFVQYSTAYLYGIKKD
jgi:hypothetical protein